MPLHPGAQRRLAGQIHVGRADVGGKEGSGRGHELRAARLVGDASPQPALEPRLALEAEIVLAPMDERRLVQRDVSGLDDQRARAAHRVEQRLLAFVPREKQQGSRQRLLEHGGMAAQAPASLVQRASGGVQAERADAASQVRDQGHRALRLGVEAGRGKAGGGKASRHRGGDCALDRGLAQGARGVVGEDGRNRERVSPEEPRRPGHGSRRPLQGCRGTRRQLGDDALDAAGRPQPEVGAVSRLQIRLERHAAVDGPQAADTQPFQLLRKHPLRLVRAGGDPTDPCAAGPGRLEDGLDGHARQYRGFRLACARLRGP